MRYNWEGDVILQDTAVRNKRYIIGRKKPITTDIREWVSFGDNIIMKDILAELNDKHGLPKTKKPGDFDKKAMAVWRFVTDNITYVHDITQYKEDDFWLFPPETCQVGKGDCEDSSFLLACLLIACDISPFCVRVVLGKAYDGNDELLGGHCWPIYKDEAGRWCILESTLGNAPSSMPRADELTQEGQSFRYEPLYCFNNFHLWEILPQSITKTGSGNLAKYLVARGKRADMRRHLQNRGTTERIITKSLLTFS